MLLDIKSNMDRLPLNSYKTQANRKVVPRLSEYELDALQQIDLAALEAVDVQTVSPDDLVDLKDKPAIYLSYWRKWLFAYLTGEGPGIP